MYIREVTTKNFGVLADGTYNFTDGMNIIRGANEKGKSTLVEAILYGMFGSGALRGTIEDTVREGLKPADLRVVVKYGEYTAKRSKSSASVVGPDTKINGQSAVSEFFYDLLGVRKGSENSVLVSEQGRTAGILDGKPGQVSALIEGLADFNQIDDIVETVKEKFPSGNSKILKEMADEVDNKLAEKEAVELVSPVVYLDKVRKGEAELQVMNTDLGELQASISSKEQEVIEIEAGVKLKEKISVDASNTAHKLDTLKKKLEETFEASFGEVDDVRDEVALVNGWPDVVAKWDLYREVTTLGAWGGDEWEGDTDSLDAQLLNDNKKANLLTTEISETRAEIKTFERQLNSEDTCPTCGQDTAHLHEKMNAEATVRIEELRSHLGDIKVELDEVEEDIKMMRAIQTEQNKRTKYFEHADDISILPWNLFWTTKKPVEPIRENFHVAQDLIRIAGDKERKITEAKEELPKLDVKIEETEEKLSELNEELNSTFTKDPADLKEIVTQLKKAHGEALEEYLDTEKEVKDNQKQADKLTADAKFLEKEIDNLVKEATDLSKRFKTDKHNAEILKQVRRARGKVLNRVWSNVLTMVSTTFSDLRGVESKVEKSDKGFTANGLPVHRLSGSGKSILGISLRVALREIFAPAAGFLAFDEPASDADPDRTAAIMAAVSGIRGQVIMITHEELSDTSADNVIEL